MVLSKVIGFDIYSDMGLPNVVEMRKDQSTFNNLTAPGVEMHCLYGSGADTVEKYNLKYFSFGFSV